jgi:hypothetical protein
MLSFAILEFQISVIFPVLIKKGFLHLFVCLNLRQPTLALIDVCTEIYYITIKLAGAKFHLASSKEFALLSTSSMGKRNRL